MQIARRHLPPLNALRAFEVAGRRLNFRAAAEELGVSQGAVAQQVRALEDHLGKALFTRLPRGLALTAAGESYLAAMSRAFDLFAEATEQLSARADGVTISVTPTFATKILIPRLADFSAALPGIDLRTVATDTISDFDRDQIDIAVRLSQPPFHDTQEAVALFPQDLVVVGSRHLIGAAELPLTVAQLRALPLLHDAHDHWPAILGRGATLPGPVFNQTTLALDAAMAGQGIAVAARAFVQADLDSGRLQQLCAIGAVSPRAFYLVRKRRLVYAPAVEAVWGWFLDQFR